MQLATTFAMLLALAQPHTGPAPVPPAMLGTWTHASCSTKSALLAIGPKVAQLGTGRPMPIVYIANDDGAGNGAIHWRQEGNVDNFVYVAESKRIVHNTQGYHMPGQVVYTRCSGRMH
jgi:hypothetical protein